MNARFLVLFTCLFLVYAGKAQVDLNKGLVAHYHFDGTLLDASGNENNGQVRNGISYGVDRFGDSSASLKLNGSAGYVSIPSSNSLASIEDSMSVFAWINIDQWYNTNTDWAAVLSTNSHQFLVLTPRLFHVNEGNCDINYDFVLDKWMHIGCIWSAGKVSFFVDGQYLGDIDCQTLNGLNNNALLIGIDPIGASEYYYGQVDDMYIYNRALNEAEIEALYNEENGPVVNLDSGLVAYFPFNGNAHDVSGNGYHGVPENAQLTTDRDDLANRAYQFNGSSRIKVGGGAEEGLRFDSTFSISAWFMATGSGTGTSPTTGGIIANKEGEYEIARFADGTMRVAAHNAADAQWIWINTNYTANLDTWYHIYWSYAPDGTQVFMNGELIYSSAKTAILRDFFPDLNELWIGNRQYVNQGFDGKIDDIRIYNRELNEAEIEALYSETNVPLVNLDSGLLVYHPFTNGSLIDESGNGRNCELHGAVPTEDVLGNANHAYEFDGEDDYLSIASDPELQGGANPFTFSLQFQHYDVTQENAALLSKYPDPNNKDWGFYTLFDEVQFHSETYNVVSDLYCRYNSNANTRIKDSVWHSLVVTLNEPFVTIYLDGEMVASCDNFDNALASTDAPIQIGGITYLSYYLKGKIDEVRIYKRILNDTEIAVLSGLDTKTNLQLISTNFENKAVIDEGNYPIIVDLVNLGSAADTVHNLTFSWQIDDEVFTTTWNDTLLPLDTLVFTLGNYTFSPGVVHSLNIQVTHINGDSITDTIALAVNSIYVNPALDHFAYAFDGTDDYIDISAVAPIMAESDAFTFECWFKHDGSPNYRMLLGINGNTASDVFLLNLRNKKLNFFHGSSGTDVTDYALDTNRWYHVACVYQDGQVAFYLNEELVKELSWNFNLKTDNLYSIGQDFDGNFLLTDLFSGQIDEVRLWNSARTPEQLRAWMTKNEGIYDEPGLVALWHFGEDNPDVALEFNAEFHGKLNGEPAHVTSSAPISDNDQRAGFKLGFIQSNFSDKQVIDEGNYPVIVDLVNLGSVTDTVHNLTFSWQIDNETFTTTWNDTLLPLDTLIFTLGNYTFSPGVVHSLNIQVTHINGDSITDTIALDVNSIYVNPALDHFAYAFDGTDDYIDISAVAPIMAESDAFTFECWFKHDGSPNYRMLLGINGNTASDVFLLNLRNKKLNFFHGSSGTDVTDYALDTNRWYHVACVYQDGQVAFYLNEELVKELSWNFNLKTDNLYSIGQDFDGNFLLTDLFSGQIDEVRLWNSARTPEQLRAWMTKNEGIYDEPGLVALWHFGEDNPDVALEFNAEFHGKLNGEPAHVTSSAPISDNDQRAGFKLGFIQSNFSDKQVIDEGNYPVIVDLVNLGSVTDTVHNLTFSWQIDDEVFTTTWNDTLLPLDTLVFTLGNYTFSPGAVHSLNVQVTHINGDSIADTIALDVNSIYVNPLQDHYAYQFDGTDDYVDISSIAPTMAVSDEFTFECWFKHDGLSSHRMIFSINGNTRSDNNAFLFGLRNEKLIFWKGGTGLNVTDYALDINRWYHAACVYQNGQVAFYLNEDLVKEHTWNFNLKTDDLYSIGQDFDGNFSLTDPFGGQIDEVRLWNSARTPEQLRAWMTKNEGIYDEPGLIAAWHFGENSRNTALEFKGQHHGILHGDVTHVLSEAPVADNDERGGLHVELLKTNFNDYEVIDEGPYDVLLTLANLNSDTINNLSLTWQSDDGIIGTLNWNDTLAPGDTAEIVLGNMLFLPEKVRSLDISLTKINEEYVTEKELKLSVQNIFVNPALDHYAYQFDGKDDYVDISSVSDIMASAEAYTVELWMKFTQQNTPQVLLGINRDGFNDESSNKLNLCTIDRKLHFWMNTVWQSSTLIWDEELSENTWYHIAYTYEQEYLHFFVNGVLVNSFNRTPDFESIDHWHLGMELDGTNNTNPTDFFTGKMDEVRFWNTARTSEELREWMVKNDGIYAEPGLIAAWHFGQNSAEAALEYQGQHHGTLFGGVTQVLSDAPVGDNDFVLLDNDLGLKSILSPQTACFNPNDSLRLEVINYGRNPIPQFDIGYRLNDGAAIWETVDSSIAPGQRYVHTFASQPAFVPGDYLIDAAIQLFGDELDSNNYLLEQGLSLYSEPDSATRLTPSDGSIDLDLPITFTWSPADFADYYQLLVWDLAGADTLRWTVEDAIRLKVNSGLAYGHQYAWCVETVNPCGRKKSEVQTFSTRALPDLQVIINSLPELKAGEEVSIELEIKNTGTGVTRPATFLNRIVLSTDSDPGRFSRVTFTTDFNVSSIAPGESETLELTMNIPAQLQQNIYYLVATVDDNRKVQEINEGNNRATLAIEIEPVPYADMIVTDVIKPFGADPTSGDSVDVAWVRKNDSPNGGTMERASIRDRIYLCEEAVFDQSTCITWYTGYFGDRLLAPQESDTLEVRLRLPRGLPTDTFYAFVETDINDHIYEFTKDGNNRSNEGKAFKVIESLTADLEVDSVGNLPATVSPRETIQFCYRVHNDGARATEEKSWFDAIYISENPQWDASDRILKTYKRSGSLDRYASYMQVANLAIPGDLSGDYYLHIVTDYQNHVLEYLEEENNDTTLLPFNIQQPDLEVVKATADSVLFAGQQVLSTWEMRNNGPGACFSCESVDRIFLSPSANSNGPGSILLNQFGRSVKELLPDSSQTRQATIQIPPSLSAGTWYLCYQLDYTNRLLETDETNNEFYSEAIEVRIPPRPDLVADGIAAPDTLISGASFTVYWQVANTGDTLAAGNGWFDYIYLTSAPEFDAAKAKLIYVHERSQSLERDTNYVIAATLSIPAQMSTDSAYLFLVTNATGSLIEQTDSNNRALDTVFIFQPPVPGVDVAVSAFDLSLDTLSGNRLNTTIEVRNTILRPLSESFNVSIYASGDSTFEAFLDERIYTYTINGLDSLEIDQRNFSFALPPGVEGPLYFFAVADVNQALNDTMRSNNYLRFQSLIPGDTNIIDVPVILRPDLQVSILSLPEEVPAGNTIELVYEVKNVGKATAKAPWIDQFYLSSNPTADNGDVVLAGFRQMDSLMVDSMYTDTVFIETTLEVGNNYYLIAYTDAGNHIFENSLESNNQDAAAIFVIPPEPGDLLVRELDVPLTAIPGKPFAMRWKTYNNGQFPVNGTLNELVVLSADSLYDDADRPLLQREQSIALIPGHYVEDSIRAIFPETANDSVYLFVRTDAAQRFIEENEANNHTRASAAEISVPDLPIDQWIQDTLFSEGFLWYQLLIPTNLTGETVIIELEATSGVHELYVSFEKAPSRIRHDFEADTLYQTNQRLIIPSVQAGRYLIRAQGNNALDMEVSLLARVLPFSISEVNTNYGSNNGKTTPLITGSGFKPDMVARLENGSTIIEASAYFYRDATAVFPTFDLTGQALGFYDVVLEKSNGDIVRLEDGFEIIRPIPGDTTTGGPGGGSNNPITGPCLIEGLSDLPEGLEIEVEFPDAIRTGRSFPIRMYFINRGSSDMVIPKMMFRSLSGAPIGTNADLQELLTNLFTALLMELFEVDGPPNILRPGARGVLTYYSAPPKGFSFRNNTVTRKLKYLIAR